MFDTHSKLRIRPIAWGHFLVAKGVVCVFRWILRGSIVDFVRPDDRGRLLAKGSLFLMTPVCYAIAVRSSVRLG